MASDEQIQGAIREIRAVLPRTHSYADSDLISAVHSLLKIIPSIPAMREILKNMSNIDPGHDVDLWPSHLYDNMAL
jgi:hypothetical protein